MTFGATRRIWLRTQSRLWVAAVWTFAAAFSAAAQVTPEEHETHHAGDASASQSTTDDTGSADGMGAMMDGMMAKMGLPVPKEIYPELMSMPDLSPERRAQVDEMARQRMQSGITMLSEGLDQLSQATEQEAFAEMQEALAILHEGLSRFDSGLAARRALAENQSPESIALHWFKKEMNLTATPTRSDFHPFGGTRFHLATIVVLGGFAIAVIITYFRKMRRASALLQKLAVTQAVGPPSTGPPNAAVAEATTSPRTSPWSGSLRVSRIISETPAVKTFRFVAADGEGVPFSYGPGQFLTLSLVIDGVNIKRSYTIASAPSQRSYCAITVKREEHGIVSRFLHDQIKEGDTLGATAPSGTFVFDGSQAENIVLLGGGVGITPLMSVIRYLTDIGWTGSIDLFYSCRTPQDYIFQEELEALQGKHANLRVFVTATRAEDQQWPGMRGRFTAAVLKEQLPDIAQRLVHVCGPSPMTSAFVDMLRTLGVPEKRIKTEAFGPGRQPLSTAGDSQGASSIRFSMTDKSVVADPGQTVLEAAEAAGIDIDSSCRSGQCGSCRVRLLSGRVDMECDDALSEAEKREGFILACQSRAREDLEVEA